MSGGLCWILSLILYPSCTGEAELDTGLCVWPHQCQKREERSPPLTCWQESAKFSPGYCLVLHHEGTSFILLFTNTPGSFSSKLLCRLSVPVCNGAWASSSLGAFLFVNFLRFLSPNLPGPSEWQHAHLLYQPVVRNRYLKTHQVLLPALSIVFPISCRDKLETRLEKSLISRWLKLKNLYPTQFANSIDFFLAIVIMIWTQHRWLVPVIYSYMIFSEILME